MLVEFVYRDRSHCLKDNRDQTTHQTGGNALDHKLEQVDQ
jgi:hypothetical protein